MFLLYAAKEPGFAKMGIGEFFLTMVMGFIVFPYFLYGLARLTVKFFNPIITALARRKDFFGENRKVIKSGRYSCKICGKTENFYKHTKFTYCFHEGKIHLLKPISTFYWKLEGEIEHLASSQDTLLK